MSAIWRRLSGLQLVAGPRAQRAERQCQTVEVKQRSAQTCREAHVQMARPDLLLNTAQDKILAASKTSVLQVSLLSLNQLKRCLGVPLPGPHQIKVQ